MKRFFSRFRNKLFLGLFVSYIVVLLLPVVSNMKMNHTLVQELEHYTKMTNNQELHSIAETMDSYITDLEEVAIQVSRDRNYRKVARAHHQLKDNELMEYIDLGDSWDLLTDNKKVLNKNKSYLFLQNQNRILSIHGLYQPELFYYQRVNSGGVANEYQRWIDFLQSNDSFHGLPVDYRGIGIPKSSGVIFSYQIPSGLQKEPLGKMIVEIDKADITQLFQHLPHTEYAFIEDEVGNRLVTVPLTKDSPLDVQALAVDYQGEEGAVLHKETKEPRIINYVISPKNGWKYVTVVPENMFYSEVQAIRNTNTLFFVLIVVVGVIVAVLLSSRTSRPMVAIAERVTKYSGEPTNRRQISDPFSVMHQGLDALIDYKNELQEGLERQKPYMQRAFLRDLSMGHVHSTEELKANLEYLDLEEINEQLYVVMARIHSSQQENLRTVGAEQIEQSSLEKTIVQDMFAQCFGDSILVHEGEKNQIAIVFFPKEDKQEFPKEWIEGMEEIQKALLEEYQIHLFVGISSYNVQVEDLWRTYQQANQALDYAVGHNRIVCYDNLSVTSEGHYYPYAIDNRLFNLSKISDKDGINDTMDILYEENFVLRELSRNSVNELLIELRFTLSKASSHLKEPKIAEEILQVSKQPTALEGFELAREIFLDICVANEKQEQDSTSIFMQDAKNYIDANYSDSNLSLHKLASLFNLSDGYFSSVFKEQVGVNFIEYLEQVRLENSKKYLETTDKTISEIAGLVGYNSAQSYRRAFKKIHDVTPNEYRESVEDKELL